MEMLLWICVTPRQRSVLSGLGVLLGFVLVTWGLSSRQGTLGWAGSQILWFLVIFLVVIPIHELGHAVAGLLVGHRIRSVVIGVGPPLLAFDLAGVAIRINLLPLGGLTMGTPRASGWLRLRLWIFAAGGPAANVALCYVLQRLYGHDAAVTVEQHRLASVAASASWTVLVLNLIPFKTGEGQGSDGHSLLTIPFWKRPQIEEARLTVEALPLIEALQRHDIDTAAPLAEALQERFPERRLVASWMGSVRHHQGRHQEAIVLWRQALAQATHPRQVAFLKNNIAFAELVLGDPEAFAEADAFSAAALAAHPELTPFVGTRGAVLVRLGRAAEALPLLRRATAAQTPARSQAYNRASLASALAMLGRTAEARQELDEARRMNPACELLEAAEADLRSAPAVPVGPAAPIGVLPAIEWERWGGLTRWRKVARGLAFFYTVAPLEGMSLGFTTVILACVILISPEATGLLVFGVCNLWIAATDRSSLTMTLVTASAGLLAMALAILRPRLSPSVPSKVPRVLAWLLGVIATLSVVAAPIGFALRIHRHAIPGAFKLALHSFRPTPSSAVALVGLAVVVLIGRRRGVRLFALVPLVLALWSLSGRHQTMAQSPRLDHLPVDGEAVVWSEPRPATVVRKVRFPMSTAEYQTVLSPGGRAFFTRSIDPGVGSEQQLRIRVRDFEGHVIDLAGSSAAFVDDQRLLVVGPGTRAESGIVLSEVQPFSSETPLWSRRISALRHAAVAVEPDGVTITLTGSQPETSNGIVVRTGFGGDAPLRITAIPSRQLDADATVGFFFTPEGGAGGVVTRQRAPRADAADAASQFVANDDRDDESNDLELWALRPTGETLLAAHLPDPDCLAPTGGRPVLWCVAGWGDGRTLLKVDPVAGRVSRIVDALPKSRRAAMIAPSKLAVVSGHRMGIVDLETHRGTWLILPEDSGEISEGGTYRSRAEPVEGGLATMTEAGEGKDATLTVYGPPP
jgi:hypothetical protein